MRLRCHDGSLPGFEHAQQRLVVLAGGVEPFGLGDDRLGDRSRLTELDDEIGHLLPVGPPAP